MGVESGAEPEDVIQVFFGEADRAERRVEKILAVKAISEAIMIASYSRKGGNCPAFQIGGMEPRFPGGGVAVRKVKDACRWSVVKEEAIKVFIDG